MSTGPSLVGLSDQVFLDFVRLRVRMTTEPIIILAPHCSSQKEVRMPVFITYASF